MSMTVNEKAAELLRRIEAHMHAVQQRRDHKAMSEIHMHLACAYDAVAHGNIGRALGVIRLVARKAGLLNQINRRASA